MLQKMKLLRERTNEIIGKWFWNRINDSGAIYLLVLGWTGVDLLASFR
jgi:hypothetical protein